MPHNFACEIGPRRRPAGGGRQAESQEIPKIAAVRAEKNRFLLCLGDHLPGMLQGRIGDLHPTEHAGHLSHPFVITQKIDYR